LVLGENFYERPPGLETRRFVLNKTPQSDASGPTFDSGDWSFLATKNTKN